MKSARSSSVCEKVLADQVELHLVKVDFLLEKELELVMKLQKSSVQSWIFLTGSF